MISMNSFLITFKPKTENPKKGFPLEYLNQFINTLNEGKQVVENWRFHNRKDVSIGDRIFLLAQGRLGPSIIGYGKTAGMPLNDKGVYYVPIHFEYLVNPKIEVLADRDDLYSIDGGETIWKSQASGIKIPINIANQLEKYVVNQPPKPNSISSHANPDWTKDELIIALDFYFTYRNSIPSKGSNEIQELSNVLQLLGQKIFSSSTRSMSFRNVNGVYMKLMNFRRLDPEYISDGKRGLSRGSNVDEQVWKEFSNNQEQCHLVAEAIKESLNNPAIEKLLDEYDWDDNIQDAPEGRLLTRIHIARERNSKLIASKKKRAMAKYGRLYCEVCGFDFVAHYGKRGEGFIECHHIEPVTSFNEDHRTHINDLILICANCHRIIHRAKPWLTITELTAILNHKYN